MGYFKLRTGFLGTLLLLTINCAPGLAQSIPQIEKFTEVNGDFQDINGVQQDEVGNLWIASTAHIEKYNSRGSEFFNIFKGLPENTGKINSIFIDSRDDIWVGVENGLLKFDPGKNLFVAIASERPSTQSNIQRITEGENGDLWIGARNGIWKYAGEKLSLVTFFPREQSVHQLLYVNRQIVFGTSKGLFVMDENSNKYKKVSLAGSRELNVQSLLFTGEFYLIGTLEDGLYRTFPNFLVTEKIYSLPYSSQKLPISGLSQDRSGNFYIATKGDGLLILNRDLKLVSHYIVQEDNNFSISDNTINGLFLDRHNTLWISTDSGQINSLNLRENNFEFLRHDPKKFASLADNYTTAIAEDRNGNIWIGNRQGLSIWNPKNDSWQHLKNLSFSQQSNIPDVIKDLKADEMHMWVATSNDGIYKVNINTLLRAHYSVDSRVKTGLRNVKALLVDSNKNIWAGGEAGNLIKIKGNDEIENFPLNDIEALRQLSTGDIIAAGRNGVFKIEKNSNKAISLNKLRPNAQSLPYFGINAISETSAGEILLATEGAGIIIYEPVSNSYKLVNVAGGLPSNRVQGLIVQEGNDIWAGTSKGLVNFRVGNPQDMRIYDKEDGLLSPVFTRGSFARLDNKLAFGTFKGVSIFSPDKLKSKPQSVPGLVIGAVEVDSKNKKGKKIRSVGGGGELNLEHDENSLRFNFYGVEPGMDRQINYSWKLEGYDVEWSRPGTQNQVNYANLPPGNYAFLVKAGTENGGWSQAEKISIEISGPWWLSPAAITGYALALLLLLIIPFLLTKVGKKRRIKKARSQVYKNISQEIGTPLTILLASLENISEEKGTGNSHRIRGIVSRLKELLDPILNFQNINFSRISQEPGITRISVKRFMQELVKDLEPLLKQKGLEIIVNNQWNQEYFFYDVNYLNKIFFNIISNSVKYSFQDGKIIINLIKTNKGDLKVQIADNGTGLPYEDQKVIREYYRNPKAVSSKGNAGEVNLLYVKDLIEKLGGSIGFESSKDQGTTFTLILKNYNKAEVKKGTQPDNELTDSPVAMLEEQPLVESPSVAAIETTIEPLEETRQTLSREARQGRIKIIIAEDNDELRKVFAASLRKLGDVYEAQNGAQAFELATKLNPSIIIADLEMPGMDGLALNKALRNDPALDLIPLYLMIPESGKLQFPDNTGNELLNIIKKPVNIDVLLEMIAEKLEMSLPVPFANANLSARNSRLLKQGIEDDVLSRLEKFIVQNITTISFTEEEIAAALGITPVTLSSRLRERTGLSIHDFVIKTKLEFAKALIAAGNFDLAEVSRLSGFRNKDLFFSAFKKHFGFMPGTIIEK
ncbi:response regulator [Antarcticibacterium arcticum]|uniref:histidine kinase n=1 Tax=Antarcticibacterium arcticum TaxID=2585771 RepID=A0A5B8YMH5_9FLAO|nr:hybrid sensor histidine kinase/response regulator transcription factor [Antarcticibacterium arcticum]QED38017.1 response regulator [Antarcticibacterium arcticum]